MDPAYPDYLASPYDDIAGMYHTQWADWYLPAVREVLDEFFFSRLPPGARVLDLCCGSGHVTRELVSRGLDVTGVDSSAGLLSIARTELPGVDFRLQDAAELDVEPGFDAALSTFDSLNHILTLDKLKEVFERVRQSLKPGGFFFFDMNLDEAYRLDHHQWSVTISDTSVGLVRGVYNRESKIAATELVWFKKTSDLDNTWSQQKSIVKERCYTEREILDGLADAGFEEISPLPALKTPMDSDFAFGRVFFIAETQRSPTGGLKAA